LATTSVFAATDLVKQITACRSCGSGSLEEVLDLGTHAVSDFYEKVHSDELRAPLCLVQCGGCGLVQLTHSVSRDRLYKDYWYRSGLNPAMVAALKDVVDDAMGRVKLNEWENVFDIGANDGTLLNQYPKGLSFRKWGIEPSQIGEFVDLDWGSIKRGFYPETGWGWYPDHFPKIITSIAMFYDLDDPNDFVCRIKHDLHPEGIWVNQMMDLDGMLAANAFDNICHEHVAYWSQTDFACLTGQHGLSITDVSRNTVNGGSIRFIAKHGNSGIRRWRESNRVEFWAFAARVNEFKRQCLDFLQAAKANGKTVLGYGASTKGNTLLQYYGIDSFLLPAIAERNPDKVGKLTAGSHIPVISEEEMRQRKPDYLLVLPWHFIDGFLEREKDLIAQGTRLVAPLPTFRVIGD
jgi:NDP-4-keto-2,6-dideoxyhexose 3-C-methyltransferase